MKVKSKQHGRCKLAPFRTKYDPSSFIHIRSMYMYAMSMGRFFYQNIGTEEYVCIGHNMGV